MDWLTLRSATDLTLPADIPHRNDANYAALRHYAAKLNNDLIAFEEVDGSEVARRVFPVQDYDLLLTPDPVIQRVGLAIRHRPGLTATLNPELTALNVYPPSAPIPCVAGWMSPSITEQNNSACSSSTSRQGAGHSRSIPANMPARPFTSNSISLRTGS